MSKQIDERVVSMQFDNAHFEKNVATSMSTLDKLKNSLKLNGATKSLEDINAAAGKVNMSGLGGAVDSVKLKFSALEVMAVTALTNITNSAVNAAKNMVRSLTIAPVSDGFREYELTLNAIQTTMAGTGKTAQEVKDELKKLDEYADKTVYSTADMLNNLPKFTNAGVKLEDATKAMIGIANATALAGGDAGKASIAFYNLGQAIGTGYLTRMDYNSINNAGIATMEWKEQMVKAALAAGTLTKAGEDLYETGGKTFSLQQLFIEGLQHQWATTDVMMTVFGKYGDALDKDVGAKAFAAAQDIKTFTMMMDSLKATAGTGWKDTWELIFGDLEEAKKFWTGLSKVLSGMIEGMADFRNGLLEGALGKTFKNLMEPLSGIKDVVYSSIEPLKKVTKTLEDYNKVVDEVIAGDWGNYKERWTDLTKAGYDWMTVQNMVNEKLGDSTRYETDFVIGQESLAESTKETTEANAKYIASLAEMSEAELAAMGLNKEQIKSLKELKTQADKLGLSVEDFVKNIYEIDGRWVVINTFKNAWAGLVKVFQAVKAAWQDVFPPKTMEERSQQLYDIIAAIHKFSTKLIMSDETAEKVTRTFKGLFAILDIVKTIIGGGISIAFKVLTKILKAFDVDLLDVTATIGDALVSFRDWLLENNGLVKAIDGLIEKIPALVDRIKECFRAFKEWFQAFKETPAVQKLVDAISAISEAFRNLSSGKIDASEFAKSLGANLGRALKSLPQIAIQIGKDFIAGFQNGIDFSIGDVIKNIVNFCLNFVKSFMEALGEHSPSVKAHDAAVYFFQGFINGAKEMFGPVLDVLKKIGEGVVKVFKSLWDFLTDESGNIEWGKIFAGGVLVAGVLFLKRIANVFDGIGDVLENAGKVLQSFSSVLNGVAWDLKAKALLKMAISIGILVAALWVLTKLDDSADPWKLARAVGIIAALAVVLIGLAFAMDKMSAASVKIGKKGASIEGLKSSILQIGLAVLMLAATVKIIGDMDPEKAKQGFIGLAGIAAGMIVFMGAMALASRIAGDAGGLGSAMVKVTIALGLLILVMKLMAGMDPEDLLIGVIVLEAFTLLVIQMGIANRIAGSQTSNFGKTVKKMATAMLILVAAIWLISKIDSDDILVGLAVLEAFVLLCVQMGIANRIAGSQTSNFGKTVKKMATSMLILAAVIWILSKMDSDDVRSGVVTMQYFVLLIAEMILVSKLAGTEAAKISGNILAMSAAIAILAGVAILLSMIDTKGLTKGVAAVGALGLIMAAMIWAARGVKDIKGSLTMMALAIGVMAAAVIALSFLDGNELAGATAAIGSLMLCFALMTQAIRGGKGSKLMIKTLGMMLGVVVVLAGIIALLSLLEPNSVLTNVTALSVLMLAFAASLNIIGKTKKIKSTLGQLMSMTLVAAALGLILIAMSHWSDPSALIPSAIALGILLNSFASAMLILSQAKRVKSTLGQLMSMTLVAAGLGIILIAMSQWSDPSALIPSTIALSVLLNAFSSAILILSQAKKIKSTFGQLMSMTLVAAGLGLLLIAMSRWSDPSALIPSAIAMSILLNAFASAILILSQAKKIKSTLGQLMSMTLVAAALGLILIAMGRWSDPSALIPSAIALGILLNAMAAAMVIASMAGQNASKAVGPMALMGLVVAELALIFAMMTALNADASIETAVALSTALLAMSAACLIASLIPAPAAVYGALGLAAFIGIMAGVIASFGALTLIPGFTEIMEKGAEIFTIIGEAIGGFVGGIIGGIGSAIISLIPQLGEALGSFGNSIKPFLAVVESTSAETIVKAGFLTATIGALTVTSFLNGLSSLFGMGLPKLGEDLAGFGVHLGKFCANITGIDPSTVDAAGNVATMLLTLTASGVLDGLTSFITGGVDYAAMGQNLQTFGEAVVNFSETISGKVDVAAVEAATNAGALLAELNKSLPRSGGLLQDLIGEKDFEKFATACKAFADCMLQINEIVNQEGFVFQEEKISQLATAGMKFSELNNSLPKSGGWAQDLLGTEQLGPFGASCKAFADCMIEINKAVSQEGFVVQGEKISQLVAAGTKFSELNSSLPKSGGWAQDLLGTEQLGPFGESCKAFADCMVEINKAVSQEGFTVNLAAIEALKQGGDKLKTLQDSLPKTGGWWQEIAGTENIGDFGAKIKTFAEALADFSEVASGVDNTAVDSAITTANRIKSLITSLVDLDTSGVSKFTGVGTGGVGADGPAYKIAKAMSTFSDEVGNINTDAVNISVWAAGELRTLIANLRYLDTSGIENFKLEAISGQMKKYIDSVSGMNAAAVSSSIGVANQLKNFIGGLVSLDSSGLANFKVGSIGTTLKSYSTSISGVNALAIASSINSANQIKSFISSLATLNTSGVGSFTSAVEKLSTVNISELVKAFSGSSTKLAGAGAQMIDGLIKGMESKAPLVVRTGSNMITVLVNGIKASALMFQTAGATLISNLINGLSSKKTAVTSAMSASLSAALTGIRNNYMSFYNAGSYLVGGFASGISANSYKAAATAKAMAEAAVEAARKELAINSPSKVFKEIGSGVPEGFAMGIGMLGGRVDRSISDMASGAINTARSAMGTVLEALSGDMNAQPTIRPVLDLSDVKTGANAIGSMFGGTRAIGVQTNLNAINMAMNRKLQNGTNDDLISAINKLGVGLEGNRGDTYNFAGITYDNGDEISEAVRTLTRAAKMGRRM